METCETCGVMLPEGAAVCPQCGTPVKEKVDTNKQEAVDSAFSKSLASLICSLTGLAAVVGVIFGIIARGRIKRAKELGCSGGKLKAANILSLIGIIEGSVAIVLLTIYYIALSSNNLF